MNKRIIIAIVILLGILLISNYQGQNDIEYFSVSSSFDTAIKKYKQKFDIPGIGVCVKQNNNNIKDLYLGSDKSVFIMGKERTVNVNSNTIFRIASVSKTITAVAILKLVDEKKINLDDTMMKYLNRVISDLKIKDNRINDITIRDLLRHSGGWDTNMGLKLNDNESENTTLKPFDPQFDGLRLNENISTTNIIKYVLSHDLNFTPGTKTAYSNFGYNLLGRIIESVTNDNYEKYVTTNIFSIADLKSKPYIGKNKFNNKNGFVDIKEDETSETYYYDGTATEWSYIKDTVHKVPLSYGSYDMDIIDAHGGWVMTADDIAQFGQAVLDGKYFGQDIFNEIIAKPTYINKDTSKYHGLGFIVSKMGDYNMLSHSGALTYGVFAYIMLIPKIKLSIGLTSNHLYTDPSAMAIDFMSIIQDNILSELK
jgi:N-acyl-D-amino-acid deacylase